MTSNRPYRDAMPPARAAEILIANSGTQFHPDVVNAFIKVLKRKNINTQKGKWKTMLIEGIIIGIVTGYLEEADSAALLILI